MAKRRLLDSVDYPSDIKTFSMEELKQLCGEVREFTIESVAGTGGHFGSNLGVVELTVALHYIFNTPKDLLIWDVGHQTYPHKILTGRKGKLGTIRRKGGLAPFPKRKESPYDVFDVGHSSTSISAAVGMSVANRLKEGDEKQVVSVIGDGALGGGMAFEALNHAGDVNVDVLIILNDNKMSISPNVGAMHKYLTRLISSPAYNNVRQKGKKYLKKILTVKELTRRMEEYAKGMITPGTLFEELGFGYYGPIDGHDIKILTSTLKNLKKIKGPKLLHVITTKGKGYESAEKDEFCLHATKPFDKITGCIKCNKKKVENRATSYTQVFSDWICNIGVQDKKVQAITPAMCAGSGLIEFSNKYPEQFHDVGIAEQHAVTFAAGLATQGLKPVVAIYSSFLQRAYDQLIHDVALQDLNILFAIDRAGIVGADGATHAGSFDLSFLRPIPNMVIAAPANENECYAMLQAGYAYEGPVAVRYPRGGGDGSYSTEGRSEKIKIGQAKIIRKSKLKKSKIAILSFGAMLERCYGVAEKIDATLINMRFVKPLDEELLRRMVKTHSIFVTVEDNTIAGGAGSAVNEFVLNNNLDIRVKNLGLPDEFLSHGTREEVLEMAGLSELGILKEIEIVKNEKRDKSRIKVYPKR